jgi:hypothetical protein
MQHCFKPQLLPSTVPHAPPPNTCRATLTSWELGEWCRAEANWLLGMGMVVAGLASSIVPVVTRLSELALLVFVMDLGLALVVASGSTLCSWANRCEAHPSTSTQ